MGESKHYIPTEDDPRNWREDFPHENGNYVNRCHDCDNLFLGHKRRITCKLCSAPKSFIREQVDAAKRESANWPEGIRKNIPPAPGSKPDQEPVAWAVFAENGNVRKWSANAFEGAEPIYRALPETPPGAWLEAMDEATCNEDAMFMELFDRHERKDIMRAAYAALRAALAEEARDG